MTGEPFFCAKNLKKTWDSMKIDLSIQADRGSMTAITGPSGSGKTTALNLIAGLIPPEGNHTLTLGGRDISRLPPGKRGVGMVFQSPALFLHLTVEDNIAYGLRCRGVARGEARERAAEWLRKIGLQGFEKRYPETLSGGEAQRVALARTLIVEPALVLFDEPLSALDAPLRAKLASEIAALNGTLGFTGILVTHDIAEARRLCSRILRMEGGRIAEENAVG
ncbi:MAG: ABC transporter ATP-binding protein [Spirochaetaceae bacterium]|jgi:ABC-type Fe3+/spermidine/putrescine transport system ATPase subunit|nr:ABC transporter ATP-binding protein [Spirochaetaceae bacterium]